MSVVVPSQDGQNLVPKPELSNLSADVLIRKVLPFMGGVRSIESRRASLQKDLKEFMARAYQYGQTFSNPRYRRHDDAEREFNSLKPAPQTEMLEALGKMITEIDKEEEKRLTNEANAAAALEPQMFGYRPPINISNTPRKTFIIFGAKGWLSTWIKFRNISLTDLSLFPMEVWLAWIEANMFTV